MYRYIKCILVAVIIVVVGSASIDTSSSMDIGKQKAKIVDTGLPVVTIYTSLDPYGNRMKIGLDKWVPARIEIKDGSNNDYDGFSLKTDIYIKGRGHSSWNMPKKGYSIKFFEKQNILGMAEGKNWVLVANYADRTLMRNSIAYDFARVVQKDGFVPAYRFVELYMNDKYMGNYMIVEKIKIDENRLNLNKLYQSDRLNQNISGGYLLEIDMLNRVSEGKDKYFTTKYINENNILYIIEDGELLPVVVSVKEPSPDKITEKQFEYIKNYILDAEKALFSENFTDPEEGYAKYFDVDSFVDWYIINELFKSVDAPMLTSVYLYKDANSKLKMGPVWDYDLSMGLASYRNGTLTDGLYIGKCPWFARLLEDPDFVDKVSKKWAELRNTDAIEELFNSIDKKYEYLKKSREENFKVWNIIGKRVWPETKDDIPRQSYDEEVQYLRDWLHKRVQWFDSVYGTYVEIATEDVDMDNTDIPFDNSENNIFISE